jgi:hypothetical protein
MMRGGHYADVMGVDVHEGYKTILTAKFIDNAILTPKYLFRAIRANTYRRVTH